MPITQALPQMVNSLNGQSGHIVNTELFSIGSVITGRPLNSTSYEVNSIIAGSSLYQMSSSSKLSNNIVFEPAGNFSYSSGNVGVGSWRCISMAYGTGTNSLPGVWVRIS